MRAVTLDFDSRRLGEREVEDPHLRSSTDVLVRIRQLGVCGTDRELATFQFGYPPEGSNYMIIGHEAVGQVVAAGSAVASLRPGDWVVPTVRRACRTACRWCAAGRRDLCESGTFSERGIFGAHGYFADYAVDDFADLIVVPEHLADVAVLVEPLSVVEKAVATALRLHPGGPRTALVLGAGSIGLLAAMVLRLRGLDVTVLSVEERTSGRARLAEAAGANYVNNTDRQFDIVIEAAGVPEAARSGLNGLGPAGVLVVLGASTLPGILSLKNLILNNQVVVGSVNASPQAFSDAVRDLPNLPREVLRPMIRHLEFGEYRRSILEPWPAEPKVIHNIGS